MKRIKNKELVNIIKKGGCFMSSSIYHQKRRGKLIYKRNTFSLALSDSAPMNYYLKLHNS